MPIDERPWFDRAPEVYLRALDSCEAALKKARRLRNQGLATDRDVEMLREARGAILSVIDYRAWDRGGGEPGRTAP